jgi:ankyrin repeat protein
MFAVDCEFDITIIRKLIELGCSPYSVDDNGDTLLHYAINLDNKDLEDILVNEYRLSIDVENNDGLTAY